MSAEYTSEQLLAVERVMKLSPTDYYEILLVERKCTSGEIKKAYRRQALTMHPDKNPAPKSDEAFKRVSDAFQVLSDESHRKIYDQTGADPRSRATAAGPSPSGFGPGGARAHPFAGARGFGGGPDDIFAQFFGGGPMGGGAMGGGGPFQFHFAAGGDTDDILSQLFGMPNRGAQRRPQNAQQQADAAGRDGTLMQIILIAAVFILPTVLSWLFGSGSSAQPSVRFQPVKPFTEEHFTPQYNVPYYVNPKDTEKLSDSKLKTLGKHAENQYISAARTRCSNEYLIRQQAMQDAIGWFYTDEEALQRARDMETPHCDILSNLGLRLQ